MPVDDRLTSSDLKILTAPFDKATLGVKVQAFSKKRDRAMLVLYLQHTDVMARLEAVDSAWTSAALERWVDGQTCYVRMTLIVKGVVRENVGEGNDPKSAYSDAIKRCAMLFGVGRYLYDSETVWAPYNEATDQFKTWTVGDYDQAAKRTGYQRPDPQAPGSAPQASQDAPQITGGFSITPPLQPNLLSQPPGSAGHLLGPSEAQIKRLFSIAHSCRWSQEQVRGRMFGRYKVGSTKELTLAQYQELCAHIEANPHAE